MRGDEEISSEEEEGDYQIPRQGIPSSDFILSADQEGVECIPPNSEVPCCVIFLLKETEEIVIFNKKSYKVSLSIGLVPKKMHPFNSVFNTCAGRNLIREDFFES